MKLTLKRGAIIECTSNSETSTHYNVLVKSISYKKGAKELGSEDWQPGDNVFIPKSDVSEVA